MTHTKSYIKAFLLPLMVYFIVATIVIYAKFFVVKNLMLEAVSIDLVLTAPVLYLLTAWKYKTRVMFVFPLVALGFTVGYIIVPEQHSALNILSKLLLPVVELASISSITYYAFRFYKAIRNDGDDDVYSALKRSTQQVFGSSIMSSVFATEFAVVWYGLLAWRRRTGENTFTCYKDNGSLVLYGFVIFILLTETFVLHFLFLRINVVFAWIVFGLSLYFAFQVLAHARAIYFRNTVIGNQLIIRYGLAGDVIIDYSQIQNITYTSDVKSKSNDAIVRLGLLKSLESYAVAIELKQLVEVESFYGLKKKANVLVIPIDNGRAFVDHVKEKIS
jgi:hypothetical protein